MITVCKDVEEALELLHSGLLWCNVDCDPTRSNPRWKTCTLHVAIVREGFKYGDNVCAGHWVARDFGYYLED